MRRYLRSSLAFSAIIKRVQNKRLSLDVPKNKSIPAPPEMETLHLQLSSLDVAEAKKTAEIRGFASVEDYIRAVVKADAIIRAIEQSDNYPDEYIDDDGVNVVVSIRQGLLEAFAENTLSEEEFWNALRDD